MDIKEDPLQDSYLNDAPGFDPSLLSKIKETINHQHIIHRIIGCFMEHKIKYEYFQNHTKKDFMLLLRKYNIKISIAVKLWRAFNNDNAETTTLIKNNNYEDSQQTTMDSMSSVDTKQDTETTVITKQASIYEQPAPNNNTTNRVYSKQSIYAQLLAAKAVDPMDKKEADGDDSDAEGVSQRGINKITRLREIQFKPKYPARAHLNIFIAKELTKELRDVIDEEFDNELILYYYKDISTALQINDHEMTEFTLLIDEEECKLSIINYDLHIKGTGQCLYGVIVPNDKWLWKLHRFMTAEQIERVYKIKQYELPKSSRLMPRFQKQLDQTLVFEESLIDDTDWFTVQQIKSLKWNVKVSKITVTLSKEMWIKECKKSFQNVDLALIPVVVNKNNNHWIEWIKIINVESQNIYVGISCKYDEDNDKWSVQSICLDLDDIYDKHRLVGLKGYKYNKELKNSKTSIREIIFSDNNDIIPWSLELQSDWESDKEMDDDDMFVTSSLELPSDWENN